MKNAWEMLSVNHDENTRKSLFSVDYICQKKIGFCIMSMVEDVRNDTSPS